MKHFVRTLNLGLYVGALANVIFISATYTLTPEIRLIGSAILCIPLSILVVAGEKR